MVTVTDNMLLTTTLSLCLVLDAFYQPILHNSYIFYTLQNKTLRVFASVSSSKAVSHTRYATSQTKHTTANPFLHLQFISRATVN